MRDVDLGSVRMPLVGLGTYPLAGADATATVLTALELGYRHLDTAQMYRNEAQVGAALARSGLPREAVFLTTKVHPDNYAPADRFRASVARSLDALGTDRVDLLLLHWPHATAPFEATLDLLLAERAAGRARAVGVSNFGVADLRRAAAHGGGLVRADQVELHPLLDQGPLLAAAAELGVALIAYCPLARGALLDDSTLAAIARRHGRSAAQVALRWLVQQGVAAVPMSRSPANLRANLALFDFALAPEEMAAVAALGRAGRRVVAAGPYPFAWGGG